MHRATLRGGSFASATARIAPLKMHRGCPWGKVDPNCGRRCSAIMTFLYKVCRSGLATRQSSRGLPSRFTRAMRKRSARTISGSHVSDDDSRNGNKGTPRNPLIFPRRNKLAQGFLIYERLMVASACEGATHGGCKTTILPPRTVADVNGSFLRVSNCFPSPRATLSVFLLNRRRSPLISYRRLIPPPPASLPAFVLRRRRARINRIAETRRAVSSIVNNELKISPRTQASNSSRELKSR